MEPESLLEDQFLQDIDDEVPARESQVQTSSTNELSDTAAAFTLFKDYLDKKLVDLKDDLKEEARTSTDLAAKKLKETSELTFRYEGNKQQHKFNRGLADQVALVSKALERRNIAQATISLDELSKLIKRRNKLIRLADKSPAGWDLVNEYLSDELASGSDDEKRIRKAEQTALRKRNNKQRGKNTRRLHPYTSTSSIGQPISYQTHSSQPASNSTFSFQRSSLRKAAPTDICFACGLQGHWRVDCRRIASSRQNQVGSGAHPTSTGGNRPAH